MRRFHFSSILSINSPWTIMVPLIFNLSMVIVMREPFVNRHISILGRVHPLVTHAFCLLIIRSPAGVPFVVPTVLVIGVSVTRIRPSLRWSTACIPKVPSRWVINPSVCLASVTKLLCVSSLPPTISSDGGIGLFPHHAIDHGDQNPCLAAR